MQLLNDFLRRDPIPWAWPQSTAAPVVAQIVHVPVNPRKPSRGIVSDQNKWDEIDLMRADGFSKPAGLPVECPGMIQLFAWL